MNKKIQVGYIHRKPCFHVLSPEEALNNSEESKKISRLTVEFLEKHSISTPYGGGNIGDGLWREVRIRQNSDKESKKKQTFLMLKSYDSIDFQCR